MRKLEQHDRLIRLREARREGLYLDALELSDKEAEVLETQSQEYFSEWTESERERFKAQQSSMWAMIPESHRMKAERYARGH